MDTGHGTQGKGLAAPKGAAELLDMFFLDMRSALLETAAAFDRIELARGADALAADERLGKLRRACELIASGSGNRAEQILLLFSDPV